MNFRYADQLGLEITFELNVLRRGTQRYSSLLYQHEGTLYADQNRIGNLHNVDSKLASFFRKAKELNVDLAITPEYSCPWKVVRDIIGLEENWPGDSKLWAICCESILPADLIQFKAEFEKENLKIFYSEHFNLSTNSFIDPLIYLFKAVKNGVSILQVIIQYKTHHMGVYSGGEVERNNIIHGSEIYILRNNPTSIKLLSQICSEAMNFPQAMSEDVRTTLRWEDDPFLILNPQLNPNPSHPDFRNFRQFVLSFSDKEIISVNWNNKSRFSTGLMMRESCSRSAFYIKSNQINTTDNRILRNHNKGLYYFFCKQDRHYFILSSTPHCFYVQNLPVKISSVVGSQSRRDGPEIISVFEFNDQDLFEELQTVNDGHIEYILGTGCNNSFLLDENKSVLDKERLVCLSAGDVDGFTYDKWLSVQFLPSVLMSHSDEKNSRFTVGRSDANREQKTRRIDALNNLQEIIERKFFPNCVSELQYQTICIGFHVNASSKYYRQNVLLDTGEMKNVTFAYLGPVIEAAVERAFYEIRSLFDVNDSDRNRVVVFYKRGNTFQARFSNAGTNITESDNYTDVSFIR